MIPRRKWMLQIIIYPTKNLPALKMKWVEEFSSLIENAKLVILDDNIETPVLLEDNNKTSVLLEDNETLVLLKEQAMAMIPGTKTTENALNESSSSQKCILRSEENVCDHCQNRNNIKAIRDACHERQKKFKQELSACP